MPLSRPYTYARLLDFIWTSNPKSILDVGVGFGGLGMMFREIVDIRWGRVHKHEWEVIIDGVEINKDYMNPLWSYIYDSVFLRNALEMLPDFDKKYDVVFLGDIIEHLTKEDAQKLLELSVKVSNKYVVITTPTSFRDNKAEVDKIITIVDRESGAKEKLEKLDVDFISLVNISDILKK